MCKADINLYPACNNGLPARADNQWAWLILYFRRHNFQFFRPTPAGVEMAAFGSHSRQNQYRRIYKPAFSRSISFPDINYSRQNGKKPRPAGIKPSPESNKITLLIK